MVARFSGHRTPAVFKRYNIVEEQDLRAAVEVLNRSRAPRAGGADGRTSAGSDRVAALGYESDKVDGG